MVELSPSLIFFAILFSVPLQFYLSPKSTSDVQFYLHRFFVFLYVQTFFRNIFHFLRFVEQLFDVYRHYVSDLFWGQDFENEPFDDAVVNGIIEMAEEMVDEDTLKDKNEIRDLFGGFFKSQILYILGT